MRSNKVLIPKEGTGLVYLNNRIKEHTKKYDLDNNVTVNVKMVHTSLEIEQNTHKELMKKVIDDFGSTNQKATVERILINAYIHGLIDIKKIESELGNLDKDVFI